jgi:hypothetical protein
MATTTAAKSGKKQTPVFSKRFFPVQVAVFEYENEGRLNHSVKLTRSFRRSEESEWETSEYLSTQDLLPAAKLLSEAYSAIQARMQKAYAERRIDSEGNGDAVTDDIPF